MQAVNWETNVFLQKTGTAQIGSELGLGFTEIFCEEINRLELRITSRSKM
jgi:hypothetical protein